MKRRDTRCDFRSDSSRDASFDFLTKEVTTCAQNPTVLSVCTARRYRVVCTLLEYHLPVKSNIKFAVGIARLYGVCRCAFRTKASSITVGVLCDNSCGFEAWCTRDSAHRVEYGQVIVLHLLLGHSPSALDAVPTQCCRAWTSDSEKNDEASSANVLMVIKETASKYSIHTHFTPDMSCRGTKISNIFRGWG